MFSSVESWRTKHASPRDVASSTIAIKYSFSPRPSSQSCSLVSHCTNSPRQLLRGLLMCTLSTFASFGFQIPSSIIHCHLLINEAFGAVISFGFDFLAPCMQRNIGAFSAQQGLPDPRCHRARTAEARLQ